MINLTFFFLIDGLDYFFLFTNLESRSFINLTHFVYNTWIFGSVDCKGATNSLKSWQTWTMNDMYASAVLLVKTFLILWLCSVRLTPFFPLNPGSVSSVLKKYSFKCLYCSMIVTSTLSWLSQRVWQWFIMIRCRIC